MAAALFDSGHADTVHDAQLDYYGRRLATCSSDRSIKVFEVAGEQRTQVGELRGHEGPVWQVCWSHPKFGSLLASCSFDHRAIVWREQNGQWEQVYKTPATLHSASINSIAWAPHELGLIFACGSSDGTISVVEHKPDGSWETSKLDNAHAIGCTAVSWAPAVPPGALLSSKPPAGAVRRLASCGCDNTVKVWRCAEAGWALETTLQGHGDWVRDVAWAPNMGLPASTIASCGQDGQVLAWSERPEGGWDRALVTDVGQPAWRVSWSVTGSILAVSYGASSVSLWREAVDGQWQQLQQ